MCLSYLERTNSVMSKMILFLSYNQCFEGMQHLDLCGRNWGKFGPEISTPRIFLIWENPFFLEGRTLKVENPAFTVTLSWPMSAFRKPWKLRKDCGLLVIEVQHKLSHLPTWVVGELGSWKITRMENPEQLPHTFESPAFPCGRSTVTELQHKIHPIRFKYWDFLEFS